MTFENIAVIAHNAFIPEWMTAFRKGLLFAHNCRLSMNILSACFFFLVVWISCIPMTRWHVLHWPGL